MRALCSKVFLFRCLYVLTSLYEVSVRIRVRLDLWLQVSKYREMSERRDVEIWRCNRNIQLPCTEFQTFHCLWVDWGTCRKLGQSGILPPTDIRELLLEGRYMTLEVKFARSRSESTVSCVFLELPLQLTLGLGSSYAKGIVVCDIYWNFCHFWHSILPVARE